MSVKVGDCLVYRFHKHVSVGFDAGYQITAPNLLSCIEEKTTYQHPEKLQTGWTGGDSAQSKFIFQAQQVGHTTLTLQNLFRFEVEDEYKIRVEIVAD